MQLVIKMIKFLNKRKKENRQSLIIDNLNADSLRERFSQRRNSLSSDYTRGTTESDFSIESIANFNTKYKENENIMTNDNNTNKLMDTMDTTIISGIQESEYYNNPTSCSFEKKRQEHDNHNCNLCYNKSQIKDGFMILTCGHIFHIRCLVDSHYTDANKCGVIDEEYFNSRICYVCSNQMEMEDILYIHNKFYRNTKEYIVRQDDNIEKLDKQMSKLKEELRVCYEYKQKLEHQREKSRQITVTINTMM